MRRSHLFDFSARRSFVFLARAGESTAKMCVVSCGVTASTEKMIFLVCSAQFADLNGKIFYYLQTRFLFKVLMMRRSHLFDFLKGESFVFLARAGDR